MAKSANKVRRPRRDTAMLVPGGLQMAGEALNIFGRLPAALHLLYYVGTLPFVIAWSWHLGRPPIGFKNSTCWRCMR